ncbi:hypothetical protein B0T21DRAFT_280959 [Apiosordaria backusii]|uniref:DUF6594 domain-containing protein n=1 Tax=Apiosordaria backusii TaxID=314023 RepID=A0AA40ETJ3_9PEZI|nr:hypothetical protein B0T21DRAFT_280959 [Apiosordaria backusii]
MLQHQPSTTSINEYRQWAHHRLAPTPDPTDYLFAAENYRALGSRPSMIDELVHSVVKNAYIIWTSFFSPQSRSDSSGDLTSLTESIFIDYGILYVLSHVFITLLAIFFFVVPLTILYLVPMPVWATVVLAAAFSMVFCVGSFYFGGGGLKSDHKFLLLFAYMSVMATLLSNLHSSSS